jgi:hypothetical protein
MEKKMQMKMKKQKQKKTKTKNKRKRFRRTKGESHKERMTKERFSKEEQIETGEGASRKTTILDAIRKSQQIEIRSLFSQGGSERFQVSGDSGEFEKREEKGVPEEGATVTEFCQSTAG